MKLIEKNRDYTPSQMAEVVIGNEDYSGSFSGHFIHGDAPRGYDYNIRDMIMQIISLDKCKGVVSATNSTFRNRIVARRIPYAITLENLKALKSDMEKECPTGFYLCSLKLLGSPVTTFDTAPSVRIKMVKCSDMAVDYPKTLDEAWSLLLEQAERIGELEALVSELEGHENG